MSQVCPHTWISLDDYSSLLIVFSIFPLASPEPNFLLLTSWHDFVHQIISRSCSKPNRDYPITSRIKSKIFSMAV